MNEIPTPPLTVARLREIKAYLRAHCLRTEAEWDEWISGKVRELIAREDAEIIRKLDERQRKQ